jgi:hypothetical protein
MRKAGLTLITVCATILWLGAVRAQEPQGQQLLPGDGTLLPCPLLFQRFPATGQTSSYVAGDDGAIQAGGALSYTDNGDGTITDKNTRLTWEKKDQAGGLHDYNATFDWSATGIFEWVAQLNAAHFAGHNDWRIPNVKEMQSIADYENFEPAVATVFNTNCSAGCTVDGAGNTTECSCTQSGHYWSATTGAESSTVAWYVGGADGAVDVDSKSMLKLVRAVRGGLCLSIP